MSEILLPRLQVPVPPAVYRRRRLEAPPSRPGPAHQDRGASCGDGASPDELLTALLNAIAAVVAEQPRGPLLIILNDVDVAGTPAATGFIGRLVDYLPGGASLWFTCRSLPDLPLARWKAVLLATAASA
ncbi:MAG: hypothetical protein QME93_11025 [Bacillota bacterium]|nr:hypothetical protein [Bacillota bacterium]MDI7250581.1 hypothetical protein [Bacillota bacterium]